MSAQLEVRKRNIAIDVLKVFAVLFVMNSHMEVCYPRYSFLSTGGAIGDALFFFASGFTLFLGKKMRFDNWYKRRINRIYPSVLAAGIFAWLVWGSTDTLGDVLLGKRYWFLGCILIYYVLLFPIKNYVEISKIPYLLAVCGISLVVLYFLYFNDGIPFYGDGNFRYYAYFLIMLQGAMMGAKQDGYEFKIKYLIYLILSIVIWFGLFYIGRDNWIMLLSFIPLMGITRYFYLSCCAPFLIRIYDKKIVGEGIYIVSQLCLEVYLIQKFVFSDMLNFLFPVNIVIVMLCVICVAYMVKMLSNFISQTFKSEPYEWKKMLLHR